jgi:hypothetical protein
MKKQYNSHDFWTILPNSNFRGYNGENKWKMYFLHFLKNGHEFLHTFEERLVYSKLGIYKQVYYLLS